MFTNIVKKSSRSSLPVDIRTEVYRLMLVDGLDKEAVVKDFQGRFGTQLTSGNLITIKASVDTVVSVLNALEEHIPGSLSALEECAKSHKQPTKSAKK